MSKITEPGIYDMTDAEYQADPCEGGSLRSSTAWKLIAPGSTPAHAAFDCPRLNPLWEPKHERYFNIGKAAHAYLFSKGAHIVLIHGNDYSRNEPDGGPKAEMKRLRRDRAYEQGLVPLLVPEHHQVMQMVKAAKKQIADLVAAGTIEANPFDEVQSEKVLVWRDQGVLCRAMMDGFSTDHDCLSEYKTEGQSAGIDTWQWKARKLGYVFRLAFYRRGLEALKMAFSPTVRIFVQETTPPHLLNLVRVDDELLAREDLRVQQALKVWRHCSATNHWPGFSIEGADLTLSQKEMAEEHGPQESAQPTAHVYSEAMPDDVYSPIAFKKK